MITVSNGWRHGPPSPPTAWSPPTSPAPQRAAPDYCDPEITGAVEDAFNDVWDVIKANDQPGSEAEIKDLKARKVI